MRWTGLLKSQDFRSVGPQGSEADLALGSGQIMPLPVFQRRLGYETQGFPALHNAR